MDRSDGETNELPKQVRQAEGAPISRGWGNNDISRPKYETYLRLKYKKKRSIINR